MESLTKENFWNDLHAKYPLAVDKFCKWIDEYKKKVNWNQMFNTGSPHYANMGWHDIKFHDLPFDMQIGIIARYYQESADSNYEEYKRISISDCTGFFKDQNELLSKNNNEQQPENLLNTQ